MYQVIARKYRPQRFSDVVSQDHVKQTIANAIEQNRIGHGYIFSGPRGTGKTTMARILAMCLNCTDGPSSNPDPDDPICKEIAAGATIDVVEIDAASNRRIGTCLEARDERVEPLRVSDTVIVDEGQDIALRALDAGIPRGCRASVWGVQQHERDRTAHRSANGVRQRVAAVIHDDDLEAILRIRQRAERGEAPLQRVHAIAGRDDHRHERGGVHAGTARFPRGSLR